MSHGAIDWHEDGRPVLFGPACSACDSQDLACIASTLRDDGTRAVIYRCRACGWRTHLFWSEADESTAARVVCDVVAALDVPRFTRADQGGCKK